jgi:hypothetical protein
MKNVEIEKNMGRRGEGGRGKGGKAKGERRKGKGERVNFGLFQRGNLGKE